MAQLQVQPHTHRFSDLGRERLGVMCPREGVEVDEHVLASAHVGPRLDVDNLEKVWPHRIELLGELLRPW
eukprot:243345-Prymnesium_polylepis.1